MERSRKNQNLAHFEEDFPQSLPFEVNEEKDAENDAGGLDTFAYEHDAQVPNFSIEFESCNVLEEVLIARDVIGFVDYVENHC